MIPLNRGENKQKKESAIQLFDAKAIRFGKFELTSGKISSYYIDMRIVPSYPTLFETFRDMGSKIVEQKLEKKIDRIAGVPTGGLPFATLIAHKTSLPLIYTREKERSHGRERTIEGELKDSDRVVVIDDLTTTGGSVKRAAKMIRKRGGIVQNAVVMLDREEGAKENLAEKGINLHPCLKISEIVRYLKEKSLLSEEETSQIIKELEEDKSKKTN